MENNLNIEIINTLGIKIANLEIQLASLIAENKLLRESHANLSRHGETPELEQEVE